MRSRLRVLLFEGGLMKRAFFPIIYSAPPAVVNRLGARLHQAAVMALKAMLRRHRALEVAHQQISYAGEQLAFSSRISPLGDLIIEFELGDARMAERVILEEDYRAAERKARKPGIKTNR
jgi:hypothetical protein